MALGRAVGGQWAGGWRAPVLWGSQAGQHFSLLCLHQSCSWEARGWDAPSLFCTLSTVPGVHCHVRKSPGVQGTEDLMSPCLRTDIPGASDSGTLQPP